MSSGWKVFGFPLQSFAVEFKEKVQWLPIKKKLRGLSPQANYNIKFGQRHTVEI
jgi:hypothetical protein